MNSNTIVVTTHCSLLDPNPMDSFLKVTGDWPSSIMRARVLLITSADVQGAGTTSTIGTKYGGFVSNFEKERDTIR